MLVYSISPIDYLKVSFSYVYKVFNSLMRTRVPFFTSISFESTQYYIFFIGIIQKIRITLLGLAS